MSRVRTIASVATAGAGAVLVAVAIAGFGAGYLPLAGSAEPASSASESTAPDAQVVQQRPSTGHNPTIADLPPGFYPSATERADAKQSILFDQTIAKCMAKLGWDYQFRMEWQPDAGLDWVHTLPASQQKTAERALYGHTGGGADYHWQDAGCHGRTAHAFGNGN